MTTPDVAEVHLDAAMECYEQFGYVNTVLWATGPGGSFTASPSTEAALRCAAGRDAITVLATLAIIARATIIGRIDEAWVRVSSEGLPADDLYPGALAKRVDTDPAVRTAVICHYLEVKSGKQALGVAVAGLDDDGGPTWSVEWAPPVDGTRVEILAKVGEALKDIDALAAVTAQSQRRALKALRESGWACLRA